MVGERSGSVGKNDGDGSAFLQSDVVLFAEGGTYHVSFCPAVDEDAGGSTVNGTDEA
jgi:hypothetical protein